MLKILWALNIHIYMSEILAGSNAWWPRALFFPQHNLESLVIYLLWYFTLFPTEMSYSSPQMGTNAERHPGSQGRLWGLELSFGSCLPELPSAEWGSSIAPLQGSVRGCTAQRDFQIPQGWDCAMTRARHLCVRSPLQVLTCKNCSAGNGSFTEPMVLWTPAHLLFFHPLALSRQLVRKQSVY